MDRNAFLAFALSFLVLGVWMTWEAKQRPQPKADARGTIAGQPSEAAVEAPAPAAAAEQRATPPEVAPPAAPPEPAGPSEAANEELVEVRTDLFHAVLTTRGAGVRRFELSRYFTAESGGTESVVLIDRAPGAAPAFATRLTELDLGDLGAALFRLTSRGPHGAAFEYTQRGITIRKTFVFEPDRYAFRLRLELANGGATGAAPTFGVELPERAQAGSDFRDLTLAALVQGSVEREAVASFGRPGFLRGEPERQRSFAGDVVWTGAYSHYFLTAVIPDVARDAQAQWTAVDPGSEVSVAIAQPPVTVPPGTSITREYTVYAGPKEPERLDAVGYQLYRSIDLGWSWVAPLTRAFIWLLHACYAVVPNYGVAIILLTVLVRLVTAPLAAKQMKSMKRMGELQPQLKALQEKYKDDRQAQSQEMMKLYREAGVNPLGGCLPMLLQIPVFIGLYYALQSSIDLRQAPFLLWIDDLSRPETLFTIPGLGWPVRVLPILMTLSMVLQQRMTPTATMDPVQQRTMMILMPVMFFFMFYGFPSGLVLYWFVSNLLAIVQQVWLNRQIGPRPA